MVILPALVMGNGRRPFGTGLPRRPIFFGDIYDASRIQRVVKPLAYLFATDFKRPYYGAYRNAFIGKANGTAFGINMLACSGAAAQKAPSTGAKGTEGHGVRHGEVKTLPAE